METTMLPGHVQFSLQIYTKMAELSEDLHLLTCKGVQFNWDPEHTDAFHALKKGINLSTCT